MNQHSDTAEGCPLVVSDKRLTKPRLRRCVGLHSGLPITLEQPKNCGAEQQAIIGILVKAISLSLTNVINYDHVSLLIPKHPIPINYRNHRYDISCLVGDRIILIDVKSILTSYWKRGKHPVNGKGQESYNRRYSEPIGRERSYPFTTDRLKSRFLHP